MLEAMEERAVTVDGQTHALPEPFMVLATQNPLDYEGTYHLPEAQLDRFMMKLHIGYPDLEQEALMLERMERRQPLERLKPVLWKEEWIALRQEASRVYVDTTIRRYIVELSAATRTHTDIAVGASPRASYTLMRAGQAHAYMNGRTYVIPDDIKGMLLPVFRHRLVLSGDAKLHDVKSEELLLNIAERVHPPIARMATGS